MIKYKFNDPPPPSLSLSIYFKRYTITIQVIRLKISLRW